MAFACHTCVCARDTALGPVSAISAMASQPAPYGAGNALNALQFRVMRLPRPTLELETPLRFAPEDLFGACEAEASLPNQTSGGSFEHAARGSRRGVSFDLSRANRGTHTPGGFTPGDAPPGEKPSKRRRAPGGAPAGTLEQALEKLSNGSETDVNANTTRSQSSAPSSADGGSPKAVSRPPSRQGSFNENAVEGLERTVSASADARRPSLDRVKSLQTAPSLDRVKALQASEAPSRNMGLVAARSFSAGDLTLLDAGDAAAAAAAGGHRGAHELDAAAFEALEENFFILSSIFFFSPT